jgi:glycosyltransferase involved in cell wall biosynthesis
VPALVKAAEVVVVDSQAVGIELAERFGAAAAQIAVVPPGVSESFREVANMSRPDARLELGLEHRGAKDETPLIGGLVSSIPRKNSGAVLEVLETLVADDEVAAVVAGWDGPARVFGHHERPASSLVTDLGAVTERELALIYRALDVFIWRPLYEGFGLPIVECASARTPVVCTPMPAAAEHISQDVAMVGDVEEAVSAVRRLLASRSAANNMADRAAAAVADLTWDRTAAGVLAVVGLDKQMTR